jgi:hypothetical protein
MSLEICNATLHSSVEYLRHESHPAHQISDDFCISRRDPWKLDACLGLSIFDHDAESSRSAVEVVIVASGILVPLRAAQTPRCGRSVAIFLRLHLFANGIDKPRVTFGALWVQYRDWNSGPELDNTSRQ